MSLSTLNNSFTPYSLSGLQNVNTDTINGKTPFNGVISNTFYPLSFNTTTGILSQTPITQNINSGASPTFEAVYLNNVNQYIRNVSGGLTIYGNNSITVASGNTLNFLGGQIVFTGTGTGTAGGLSFNANANISCGSGLDLILTTLGTADNILFVSGTTQKFKINSSGVYAPSLSSSSQTYILFYNLGTGQITYQLPPTPTIPLSITVNNITSQTATDLTLNSSAGIIFNISGTTYGTIDTNGLLINNIGSIGGQNLSLSSTTGLITTGSSFSIYGGNLNLLDYATGLIQSQFFTDTTGLIIRGPTSKDIRLQIGFTNIMITDASGINIQGSLPIKSAANTNLILNVPSSGYQMNLQHAGTTKAAITTNGLTVWNSNLYNAGASLNIRNSTASTAYITLGNMDTVNNPFIQFVNSSGNNAGYIQSTYATPTISQLAINSTGNIDLNASSTGSINLSVGSTLLAIGSGVIATLGNINIGGTGRFTGLLTQDFPVNIWYKSYLSTFNPPVIYQATSATLFTNVSQTISSGTTSFFNYDTCNATTQNWTPFWGTNTNTTRGFLYFPYTGVYTINWSFGFSANIVFIATINKNWSIANWSASIPPNDSSMLSCLSLSPTSVYNSTLSATVRIDVAGSSGDYVSFCIYNFSGSTTVHWKSQSVYW